MIEAEISEHESTLAFREQKIAEMNAQLDNVSGQRREALLDKIEKWEAKIDTLDGKIDNLTADLAAIYAEIGQIEVALSEAQGECDGGGTETGTGTYYLHADHLGKPQIATDSSGAIVWDGGITTPFGEGVSLAGAFAQSLMFPGQYADMETALNDNTPLFHNWHRTYDPTLGRYLQSDPIGLEGGINRYAYVGGNPMGYVDEDGQIAHIVVGGLVGGVLGLGYQALSDAMRGQRSDLSAYVAAYAGGVVAGGVLAGTGNPFAAGAAGAAIGDISHQLLDDQPGINVCSTLWSTTKGAAYGGFPSKLPWKGVNKGSNSYLAIAKQIRTKLRNKTIKKVRPKTGAKMAIGDAHEGAALEVGVFDAAMQGINHRWVNFDPIGDIDCRCRIKFSR